MSEKTKLQISLAVQQKQVMDIKDESEKNSQAEIMRDRVYYELLKIFTKNSADYLKQRPIKSHFPTTDEKLNI